jgi:hypothetical protein
MWKVKSLLLLTHETLPDSEIALMFFLDNDRKETGGRGGGGEKEYLHVCANETVTVCRNLNRTDGSNCTLRTISCALLHASSPSTQSKERTRKPNIPNDLFNHVPNSVAIKITETSVGLHVLRVLTACFAANRSVYNRWKR